MPTNSQPGSYTVQPDDFKVYRPPSFSPPALADLPDDYFTPTAAEVKAAQATMIARTQALTNAPLKIRAVRDAEAAAKRDRWPETTIRVKFMDQTQLEKVFPSTGKIKGVYAFVRGCLREDVKPIKFVLYQPPQRDLKVSDLAVRDLTLSQLQLSPSSVLLLRFEDNTLNHPTIPAPLAEFVQSYVVDLPKPAIQNVDLEEKAVPKPSQSTKPSTGESKSEAKVPKWLKLGKK